MNVLKKGTKDFFMCVPYLVEAYYNNKQCLTLKQLVELSGVACQSSVFTALTNVRILHSLKGRKQSGYIFARDPKEIMTLEITRALQGMPYSLCSSVLHTRLGKQCPLCSAITKGIQQMALDLGRLSLYDYAQSVKMVQNTEIENENEKENI